MLQSLVGSLRYLECGAKRKMLLFKSKPSVFFIELTCAVFIQIVSVNVSTNPQRKVDITNEISDIEVRASPWTSLPFKPLK